MNALGAAFAISCIWNRFLANLGGNFTAANVKEGGIAIQIMMWLLCQGGKIFFFQIALAEIEAALVDLDLAVVVVVVVLLDLVIVVALVLVIVPTVVIVLDVTNYGFFLSFL